MNSPSLSEEPNITLIGMSGVGKSYIGAQLAESLDMTLLDVDATIETQQGMKLSEYEGQYGTQALMDREGELVREFVGSNTVISPGGSIVYNDLALEHLRDVSLVVYLHDDPDAILERIGDGIAERCIVGYPEKSFPQIYNERLPLYQAGAHVQYDLTGGKDINTIVKDISDLLVTHQP